MYKLTLKSERKEQNSEINSTFLNTNHVDVFIKCFSKNTLFALYNSSSLLCIYCVHCSLTECFFYLQLIKLWEAFIPEAKAIA